MKAKPAAKALTAHRKRLKRDGQHRLELRAGREDLALLRAIAAALRDPARKAETRALLRRYFGKATGEDLKAYLAAAPLEGVDLTRARDYGRDVKL